MSGVENEDEGGKYTSGMLDSTKATQEEKNVICNFYSKLRQRQTSCGITLTSASTTHKVIFDTLKEVLQDEIKYGSDDHIQLAVNHTYATYEAQCIIAKCKEEEEENVGLAFELNAIKLDLSQLDGLFHDMSPTNVGGVGGNVYNDNGGDTSPQRQVRLHKSDDDDEEKKDDDEDDLFGMDIPVARTTPIPHGNYPSGTEFHPNGLKYSKLFTDGSIVIPLEDVWKVATELDRLRVTRTEDSRLTLGFRYRTLCREITCNTRKSNTRECQEFCNAHYTYYLEDSEANRKRKAKSARAIEGNERAMEGLPKLTRHIVPPGYEDKVRNGMSFEKCPNHHAFCRFDVCQTYAQFPYPRFEGLCKKHSALYSIFNMMIREARIDACLVALSTNPENLSLFDYFFSHGSPDGDDADVHMATKGLPWYHFTDADLENGGWKLVDEKIVLVCNGDLDMETLEAVPHWNDLDTQTRNEHDKFIWGTTDFVGGTEFIKGHHNVELSKGKVLYCLVFTVANEAYHHKNDETTARANQYRIANGTIGRYHECMVRVQEKATPCHVLKIEFTEDYVEGGKSLNDIVEITAIRVNGMMTNNDVVEIDTKMKSNFKIAKGFIECTHNEEESE